MFRILAIDDHPETIHGSLESLRYDGYDVVSVVDASAAEDALRSEDFDLIVSDSVGIPALSALVRGGLGARNAHVPYVFLTGHRGGFHLDEDVTHQRGFRGWIYKADAVTPALRHVVEAVSSQRRVADAHARRAGAWLIIHAATDAAWASWITAALQPTNEEQVLVLVSECALHSPWVRARTAQAIAEGMRVVPVIVEGSVTLPDELADLRAIDLSTEGSLDMARAQLAGRAPLTPDRVLKVQAAPPMPRWFTDRVFELDFLSRVIGNGGDSPARVVIAGAPGTGKTAVARAFADRCRERFARVEWLDAARARIVDFDTIRSPTASVDDRRSLLVLDDVRDYHAIAATIAANAAHHVLITSRNTRWGDPFELLALGALTSEASAEFLRAAIPTVKHRDAQLLAAALGGMPASLIQIAQLVDERVASVPTLISEIDALALLLDAGRTATHGSYWLGTDDPAIIAAFERALCDALEGAGNGPVMLLEPLRGSWKREWRRRYNPDRVEALADKAERAVEVATLTKPESQANRDNAEAMARLLEASAPLDDVVLISGSVLLIKSGGRAFAKTLTATELRRYEEEDGAANLSSPVRAMAFLDRIVCERATMPSSGGSIEPSPATGELGV